MESSRPTHRSETSSPAAPLDHIIADGEKLEQELKELAEKPVTNETLMGYAEEFRTLRDEKDEKEAELKQINDRLKQLREDLIPNLMQRLGMVRAGKGSFTFSGGRIHLETKLYASCPEANRPSFFDWLRSIGEGDLIKEQVNAQTLSAWVRDRRDEGHVDPPGLSIHETTSAKLTK